MTGEHPRPVVGLLPPPRPARHDHRGTAQPPAPQTGSRDCETHSAVDGLTGGPRATGLPPADAVALIDTRSLREGQQNPRIAEVLFAAFATLPPDHPDRALVRQRIVESHLPLVHHLAQRFRGRGEPYDDLVQVGTIGLLNAVDRFDPARASFTTFAVPTILGEIRRHFRDRGWAIRVPRRLQDLGRHVSGARETLTQDLGRSPTIVELAHYLDSDPDLVVEALETVLAFATVPLPTASEEAEYGSLGCLDRSLERVEERLALLPLLDRLPTRQRRILALRFGRGLSQSQIAAEVGVSQMHVSRLLTRSLATLRKGLSDEA